MKNGNKQKGNGVLGLIIIIAIFWGVSSLFGEKEHKEYDDYTPSYNSGSSNYNDDYSDSSSYGSIEPENPYDEGSGHSAGYEWAQENDVSSCDGNSDSFIEGCEEYLSQQEEY